MYGCFGAVYSSFRDASCANCAQERRPTRFDTRRRPIFRPSRAHGAGSFRSRERSAPPQRCFGQPRYHRQVGQDRGSSSRSQTKSGIGEREERRSARSVFENDEERRYTVPNGNSVRPLHMPPQQIPLRERPGEEQRNRDRAAVAQACAARSGAGAPLPRGNIHGSEGKDRRHNW